MRHSIEKHASDRQARFHPVHDFYFVNSFVHIKLFKIAFVLMRPRKAKLSETPFLLAFQQQTKSTRSDPLA
jgi:hypothetical protein